MDASLVKYAAYVAALHSRWTPHDGQTRVGRALFQQNIRRIFIQCGRKWGKSEIAMYILVRWAVMNPGSACYYIAPFQKQAKEIIWQRLLKFIPPELMEGEPNRTELRIPLKGGSFIKVDGSDNYEAYRGITPDIVIYDEFKDFRPEFHIAMEPNLAPKNAPLVILGTPPNHDCQYTELADEFRDLEDCAHFIAPTEQNPHIPKDWLSKMREKLIARGELDVWEREYMARFIKGGANAVFPMFSRERHVFNHDELMKMIERDKKKLQWFTVADPGTASCFGVLIAALNPYTKVWYWLDEIYEKNHRETSTGRIWPRMQLKEQDLHPQAREDDFDRTSDEAAAWFRNEMMDRYNVHFRPTEKSANAKEEGLSLIKDQLLGRFTEDGQYSPVVYVSDRCENLIWEAENYIKDEKTGKIPKKNDHLLDCIRYLNAAAGYDPTMVQEPAPPVQKEGRRGFTIEEDLASEDDPFRYF